jgi:hypothetical protein
VLDIIRPLLALQGSHLAALSQLSAPAAPALRLGLTTAFEQGIFAAAESALGEYGVASLVSHHRRWPSWCERASWMRRWWRCR